MKYKLDKNLFENNKYLRLFGEDFVKINENKCNTIINGKEYEIIPLIDVEEFEKYNIKAEDETLEVILKDKTIEDMSCMFLGCESLIKIDLSLFNSQTIIKMGAMFTGCENLIKVNLKSFNTKNVRRMGGLFGNCKSLNNIDLSSFNTENVTDMSIYVLRMRKFN